MDTLLLLPISDAGPNDGVPSPGLPASHWDKVDDDPNDGDTSFVTIVIVGGEEAFLWDASALGGLDVVPEIRVRWAVKAGDISYLVRAGLMINGTRYYGPDRMPGVGSYTVYEESFTTDPSDGAAWTAARVQRAMLIAQHVQIGSDLPRPRFSELIGLASRIAPPVRPTATDAALAPGATQSAPSAPAATAQGIVPAATPAGIAPGGAGVAVASAASISGSSASATAADVGPKAYPAPIAPQATVTPVLPSAAVAAIAPVSVAAAVPAPTGEVS